MTRKNHNHRPTHGTTRINRNCLGQFRRIPWNQAMDVHWGSTLITWVITWSWRHRNRVNTIPSVIVLRHKAGQEGRGEILLENSLMRWWCYRGKIMHTTSNNFPVLYVLKNHRQHINNTMTPPTLLFLASWPSYTRASCHSKIISIRINLRVSCSRCTSTCQK